MDNFDQVMMRRFVDDNITSRDIAPLEIPTDKTGADLAEKMRGPDTLQEADILRDRQFAQHAKDIHKLYEGKDFVGTDREASEYGLEIMGEFYFNFAGPGINDNPGTIMQAATLIASGTEDTANSFLYMLDQYEQLPNWTGSGLSRAFNGIFSDPTTYAGLFTLGSAWVAKKLAGGAAREGVRLSLQNIAKNALAQKGVVGAVTRTAAEYPARVTAGTTAFQGGVSDIAEQSIEVEAGIERDVTDRIAQNLLVTGVSGAAGYGLAKGAGFVGNVLSDAASAAAPIIDRAGQAAEARMAERGPITDRVMSGADPMEVIDPVLAAAGKLVSPTKENPITAVPPTETEPGIIAFHGSGADFDQFSVEKIGTGEGAQAYGYGLYFTDSEDIANFYRQTVGGGTGVVDFSIGGLDLVRKGEFRDYSPGATPFGKDKRYKRVQNLTAEDYAQASLIEDIFINEGRLYNEIKKPGAGVIYEPKKGDELKDELIKIMYETLNSKDPTDQPGEVEYIQNLINSVTKGEAPIKLDTEQYGKTYKVGLEPKPDELMDYDLSLNQQPEKIKKVLQPFYEKYGVANTADVGTLLESARRTGTIPDDALTEKFVEAGIPGIKYRAAGSRGASVDAADVEMNYVIFDDKAIKILEKYGIVGPVAITALGAEKQDGEEM